MKIFVCVKQVPDTETKAKIVNEQLDLGGVKWCLNPFDEFAVEEALKLKTTIPGSEVVTVTIAPKTRGNDVLRTVLAMGADRGVLVDSALPLDHSQLAKSLAKLIQNEQPGIVFMGSVAADDNAGLVPPLCAQLLNWNHASFVTKFQWLDGKILVEQEIEGGAKKRIELNSPCIIGATRGLNNPRYPNVPAILQAKKKPIQEIEVLSLLVDGSKNKTSPHCFQLPPESPSCQLLQGDASQQTQELVQKLRTEAKVI